MARFKSNFIDKNPLKRSQEPWMLKNSEHYFLLP